MRTKSIILLSFFLLGGAYLGKAQTLQDYLILAAENNPMLKGKYAEFEASLQKVAQANSLPDPTISMGYFISPVETRVGPQLAKFGLNQMFPWFGTLKSAGQIQALNAEYKFELFLQARNELFYQVKQIWFELHQINEEIDLQKEHQAVLESFKQLATTGFKNGKSSLSDVLRVDIKLDQVNSEIRILDKKLKPLNISFNRLLNRPDSEEIVLSEKQDFETLSINYRRDSLIAMNPLLSSLEIQSQLHEESKRLARLQGMPKFGVGIDYVLVGKRSDMSPPDNGRDILMPMVSMSIPINRAKYSAAIQEAQFNKEAVVNYRENLENLLFTEYESAWFELEKASELSDLYTRQSQKTEQVLNLYVTAYKNSGSDFEEILRLQEELISLKISDSKARRDYCIQIAKLDLLTSKSE